MSNELYLRKSFDDYSLFVGRLKVPRGGGIGDIAHFKQMVLVGVSEVQTSCDPSLFKATPGGLLPDGGLTVSVFILDF
ncbi:MAG: hypothetical protein HKL82_03695 [Acidimicrobiaceae bacterium]|nr:hypothetical protein [Acidimicrobiaceae bacterium]